jgi:Zn-dependent protease with chaperone function
MTDRGDSGELEAPSTPPEPNERPEASPPASDRRDREESSASRSDVESSRRGDSWHLGDLDRLALTTLVLPLPWYLLSVGVVYWTSTLFVDEPWARTILGLWLLSGVVMLWRPIEERVATTFLQLRHPIQSESEKLASAWSAVTRDAHPESARFSLLIQESTDVSASGSGGRVVAVTRSSVVRSPHQLEAILAHELGHHPDGYSSIGAAGLWYSLPARAATWWIRNFGRMMQRAPAIGCLIAAFVSLGLLGVLLAAVITDHVPFALFGVGFVLLAPLLLAWVDRQGELNADRVAASRGYGRVLLEILQELHAENETPGSAGERGGGVLAGQPGVADRIRALERYLSRRSPS